MYTRHSNPYSYTNQFRRLWSLTSSANSSFSLPKVTCPSKSQVQKPKSAKCHLPTSPTNRVTSTSTLTQTVSNAPSFRLLDTHTQDIPTRSKIGKKRDGTRPRAKNEDRIRAV